MLRRELIMLEPYRQRRFHGHRKRVASASAVVDSGPPVRPRHVVEPARRLAERRQLQWRHLDADIRLMRALADIMDSKRLDNDNVEFDKYRRLLQGSRTRSVDRFTPLPPPPDPFPTTDDRGKPLRLCQRMAARPRARSSPSPSPLDQWPDDWLLRHRQQRAQQQQQQQQQWQRRRRRSSRAVAGGGRGSGGRHTAPPGTRGRSARSDRASEAEPDPDNSQDSQNRSAGDSDSDAESAGSGAGGRDSSGSAADRVGPRGVPRPSVDLRSDPEARDRLRRYGMVLMAERSGCQCVAWKPDHCS